MGNASGGNDGEGPSGTKKLEGNYGGVYLETSPSDHGVFSEPMEAHPPPNSPRSYQSNLLFAPHHDLRVPLQRHEGLIQSLQHSMSNRVMSNNMHSSWVKLSWDNGGKQVAVTGSWDNWETRELLQRTGNGGFYIIKLLPPGEYRYLFIVDGYLRCAPDLPWICDGSGNAYNVLDLQKYDSELPESLWDFESPSSPPSSYDNKYLNEDDFSKPPPETPPQLQASILNEPPYSNDAQPQPLTQSQRSELNHLYIQDHIEGQFVALASTRRFRQKYVTMVLYKPIRRTN